MWNGTTLRYEEFERITRLQLKEIIDSGTTITFPLPTSNPHRFEVHFTFQGKPRKVIAYFQRDGFGEPPSEIVQGFDVLFGEIGAPNVASYEKLIGLLHKDSGFIIGTAHDISTSPDPKRLVIERADTENAFSSPNLPLSLYANTDRRIF